MFANWAYFELNRGFKIITDTGLQRSTMHRSDKSGGAAPHHPLPCVLWFPYALNITFDLLQ